LPGQATGRQAHVEPFEHAARMRIIEARAMVLLAMFSCGSTK